MVLTEHSFFIAMYLSESVDVESKVYNIFFVFV